MSPGTMRVTTPHRFELISQSSTRCLLLSLSFSLQSLAAWVAGRGRPWCTNPSESSHPLTSPTILRRQLPAVRLGPTTAPAQMRDSGRQWRSRWMRCIASCTLRIAAITGVPAAHSRKGLRVSSVSCMYRACGAVSGFALVSLWRWTSREHVCVS